LTVDLDGVAGSIPSFIDELFGVLATDYPTAHVRVRLKDDRVLTRSTGVVRGDAANPVPMEDVVAKFLALTSGPLGARRAREVLDAADGVDGLKDIRDLTALLAPPQI
jgi:hypothetical protein